MHRWLGMVWPRMIPIPAKPFHHKLARCEVSHTTELCKHITLPRQISLCFLLNYCNLELPNKLLWMSQWDSCKSQTPRVTCSESRTFSFRLCCIGITVSLMSICLMTPCLRSCSSSCLLVRVSPNHNAEGPWAFGVCFQPWKIINVLMPIQAIVYKHFIRTQITKIWVAMAPALPVLCWLLPSVPRVEDLRSPPLWCEGPQKIGQPCILPNPPGPY